MNQNIKAELFNDLSKEEAEKAEKFLDGGFSNNGQIVIASIFLLAKMKKKKIEDVLEQCKKEYERNWYYQHPAIRGDPDAPGGAGVQNRRSLENIYAALKMPSPLSE